MKNIAALKQRLGVRLFKLAFTPDYLIASQNEQRKYVRESHGRKTVDGRSGLDYKRQVIKEVSDLIATRRRALKRFRRAEKSQDIHERLAAFKKQARLFAVESAQIRYGDHLLIRNGVPDVSRHDIDDWNYYSKRTKYAKQITTTTLTFHPDWRQQMRQTGMPSGVIDGLLTLSAEHLPSDEPSVGLFKATWVEQGAGYHLKAVTGFIATSDGLYHHGLSAEQARRGLARKVSAHLAENEIRSIVHDVSMDAFLARYQHATFWVSLNDARASGSCETGIKSWCMTAGIDIRRQRVPVQELLTAYKLHPRSEVRAAVVFAARRHNTKKSA